MTSPTGLKRIAPQSGVAFELRAGEVLRIVDPQGEQVADLVAFTKSIPRSWLSSGKSIDFAGKIFLTTGDVLYSNLSQPMLSIVRDTVGRHDFLLAPCSQETFDLLYEGDHSDHPNCLANLAGALAAFDIRLNDIPNAFNVFMNVEVSPHGMIEVCPPRSRPADHIELRAEQDLIIGLTACSAEKSNNYRFKPIDFVVLTERRV
jgi:uncharacterized protein YcgI (DUF1989 family)